MNLDPPHLHPCLLREWVLHLPLASALPLPLAALTVHLQIPMLPQTPRYFWNRMQFQVILAVLFFLVCLWSKGLDKNMSAYIEIYLIFFFSRAVSGSSSSTLMNMSNLSTSNPSLSSGHGGNASSVPGISALAQPASGRPISLPTDPISGLTVKATGKQPVGKIYSVLYWCFATVGSLYGLHNPARSSGVVLRPFTGQTFSNVSDAHRDEMLVIANEIQTDVSNLVRGYTADRDRLKQALDMMEMSQKSATLGGGKTKNYYSLSKDIYCLKRLSWLFCFVS